MKTFFAWFLTLALVAAQTATTNADIGTTKIDCDNRSVCTDKDPNVCGSDGDTYANKCTFESAYCDEPNELLFVVSEGACVEPPSSSPSPVSEEASVPNPAPTPAPTFTIDPTTTPYVEPPAEDEEKDLVEYAPTTTPPPSASQQSSGSASTSDQLEEADANDMSKLYCQIKCALDGVPVCDTDGKPYINDCHLLAAKCKFPNLAKAYNGACVEGQSSASTSTSTTTVEVTASGAATTVKTKCNPICARVCEPVCGSNSVTYANQCLLDYAACKNPRVTKLSNGKCIAKKKGKGCVPVACTSEEDPVCASNGVSYLNTCMFENAQCQFPELSILHEGECNEDTVLKCSTLTSPKYTECREDADLETAYCADVCAAERCGEHEEC
ncbi:Kazal-type serine protease inhibitor, partial [Globisporangium splendens]